MNKLLNKEKCNVIHLNMQRFFSRTKSTLNILINLSLSLMNGIVFLENTIKIWNLKTHLDYLRDLFKNQLYVELCYMTGILPIKKYGTHSALNMFDEILMINHGNYEEFMDFTEKEVISLCKKYDVDFAIMQEWYNGYHLEGGISIYSPRTVSAAINTRKFKNYWSQTEN